MTAYLPDMPWLKPWSKAWAEEIVRSCWDKVHNRGTRAELIRLTRDHSVRCACGSDKALAYSITGQWRTPDDYIVECRECHYKRVKVLKPVGRPKGSKTKYRGVPCSWEQRCKVALDSYEEWRVR